MSDRIIKAAPGTAPSLGDARILKQDAFAAAVEARSLLEAAQKQARDLVEEAERARERIREAAREEGYREGLARWNEEIVRAADARHRALESHEPDLIRLAVRIAGKIIGEELRSSPETIASIVREALESVRQERVLTLKIHPDSADEIRNRIGRLEQALGGGRQIHVVADAAVAAGGCVIETELGVIDARLETQLRCLEEALLRATRK